MLELLLLLDRLELLLELDLLEIEELDDKLDELLELL